MASITISAAAARVVTPIAKAPSGSAKLGRSAAPANAAASRVSFPARKPRSLTVTSAGLPPNLAGMMGNMDPEKLKEIQAAYEQAMKDPETAKKVNAQMAQMQQMMNNPMVAKQMQAMNNMIANPDMQRRIAGLKDDPEFQDFFQDVQKNGPSAMMKYSNDAAFLKKLNDKLGGEEAIRAAVGGDIPVSGAAAPADPRPRPRWRLFRRRAIR